MRPLASASPALNRYPILDALRGVALLAMFAYHFCFDLVHFGIFKSDPYDSPIWMACRTLILGTFLLLAGTSFTLANRDGVRWQAFWRRFGQIAGCALLVSIGSYAMFPASWIYFGVLHHIALASLLALALLRFDRINLWLGIALIGLGMFVRAPLFDLRQLNWIGLMTHKPITEDYVPLLPWFGVVMIGMFLGQRFPGSTPSPFKDWRPAAGASRLLALAGRHTLLLYILHQPVFIGLLYLFIGR